MIKLLLRTTVKTNYYRVVSENEKPVHLEKVAANDSFIHRDMAFRFRGDDAVFSFKRRKGVLTTVDEAKNQRRVYC